MAKAATFLSCHRALLDLTKNLEIPAAGYDTDTLSKPPVRPTALAEKKSKRVFCHPALLSSFFTAESNLLKINLKMI